MSPKRDLRALVCYNTPSAKAKILARGVNGVNADFIVDRGQFLYAQVDLGVYELNSLLRVAHRFTDRCYLHLQMESVGRVGVRFRSKTPNVDCAPIVGQFMNELLDQTLRSQISAETEPVRNLILAHALSQTALIHPELETAEPTEDPDGIGTTG